MKILIADDHPIVRRGLRQVLESDPTMVVVGEATNGDEALELARTLEWDLAVFDFSMPGRSGLDLLDSVKREFPGRPYGTDLVNPDFAAYAGAFGAHGEVVSRTEEFADAFERALESGLPAILELRIHPEAVSPRATLTEIREAARSSA